jgi:hypothetical protein
VVPRGCYRRDNFKKNTRGTAEIEITPCPRGEAHEVLREAVHPEQFHFAASRSKAWAFRAAPRFRAFMEKYYPEADRSESGPLTAWNVSTALVTVLKRCGDNLTRENVMKVVANMDFEIDTYIPGIHIKTTPTDFYPIEQVQMMKFSGAKWELFGPIIDGHAE